MFTLKTRLHHVHFVPWRHRSILVDFVFHRWDRQMLLKDGNAACLNYRASPDLFWMTFYIVINFENHLEKIESMDLITGNGGAVGGFFSFFLTFFFFGAAASSTLITEGGLKIESTLDPGICFGAGLAECILGYRQRDEFDTKGCSISNSCLNTSILSSGEVSVCLGKTRSFAESSTNDFTNTVGAGIDGRIRVEIK
jgi:hypothetical protein